jgi:hypothetical protein
MSGFRIDDCKELSQRALLGRVTVPARIPVDAVIDPTLFVPHCAGVSRLDAPESSSGRPLKSGMMGLEALG